MDWLISCYFSSFPRGFHSFVNSAESLEPGALTRYTIVMIFFKFDILVNSWKENNHIASSKSQGFLNLK